MQTYLVLLRGINVGGKNKVPMSELRTCLEGLGFSGVTTYIASGNAIITSDESPDTIKTLIETALPKTFTLDSDLIKVLILSQQQLAAIVKNKPDGFGDEPNKYHSDALFTIDVSADDVMPIFNPRDGVDKIWQGDGVIYSQRLSAERTKSRLSTAMMSPLYKSLTIRSWNTTIKLLDLMNTLATKEKTTI